jgi:hypothetical protein
VQLVSAATLSIQRRALQTLHTCAALQSDTDKLAIVAAASLAMLGCSLHCME